MLFNKLPNSMFLVVIYLAPYFEILDSKYLFFAPLVRKVNLRFEGIFPLLFKKFKKVSGLCNRPKETGVY